MRAAPTTWLLVVLISITLAACDREIVYQPCDSGGSVTESDSGHLQIQALRASDILPSRTFIPAFRITNNRPQVVSLIAARLIVEHGEQAMVGEPIVVAPSSSKVVELVWSLDEPIRRALGEEFYVAIDLETGGRVHTLSFRYSLNDCDIDL